MPLELGSALSIEREPVEDPEIRVQLLEAIYLIALQVQHAQNASLSNQFYTFQPYSFLNKDKHKNVSASTLSGSWKEGVVVSQWNPNTPSRL